MTLPDPPPKPYRWGDLVKTSEGYFAIVVHQKGSTLSLFLCNGLGTEKPVSDVTPMVIKHGPARANFAELLNQAHHGRR